MIRRWVLSLHKTVRKYFGEAVVVTQELDDIVSSPIIKDTIINNADCKILLDQRKYINKFDSVQSLLVLTDKEKGQILSINATETSVEEYLTYTTEETEKLEVTQMTEKLGGNMEQAIRMLASEKKKKK